MGGDGTMSGPPRLVEGRRLDQRTFHALYESMPPGTRAELINGVVYMPGPVGPRHGRAHLVTAGWINCYLENAPGVDGRNDASTPGAFSR